ncbi:hypothetical protein [Gordonia tangerina]|jgi:hypothetical protein|nr:hypothetical protein [Gordonia tangerina]
MSDNANLFSHAAETTDAPDATSTATTDLVFSATDHPHTTGECVGE